MSRIYVDTREHPSAIRNILATFDRQGIAHELRKLDVGDYRLDTNPALAIDRKQSLGEVCTNLCSPGDKGRFWREVQRAREQRIKLIVLCEHGKGVRSIEDVAKWRNTYGLVSGRDLMEAIYKCHISYGVEFLFCDKCETGDRIIELLGAGSSGNEN